MGEMAGKGGMLDGGGEKMLFGGTGFQSIGRALVRRRKLDKKGNGIRPLNTRHLTRRPTNALKRANSKRVLEHLSKFKIGSWFGLFSLKMGTPFFCSGPDLYGEKKDAAENETRLQ